MNELEMQNDTGEGDSETLLDPQGTSAGEVSGEEDGAKETPAPEVAKEEESEGTKQDTTQVPALPEEVEPLMLAEGSVSIFDTAKRFVSTRRYTIAAVILVLVGLVGILTVMQLQGKVDIGALRGVEKKLSQMATVALVNNEKITEHDLGISIAQIATGAAAQGVNIEDPTVKDEIRTQALDMLINTELLKQEAAKRGIEVSDDEVEERLTKLREDVGGEEILKERMVQFSIDEKTLIRDIKNELTIQKLLDEVFAERDVAVSEDEIKAFYEQAGGAEAGFPELEQVRSQIETQIKTSKEQEIVTSFIEELRSGAVIEKK